MRPAIVILALWIGWVLSWVLAALWSNRTDKRPAFVTEIGYRILMIGGALLMFPPAHGYEGRLRLWQVSRGGAWLCVAGVAIGIVVAWWARPYLGPLWSSGITRKSDHRVVDSGSVLSGAAPNLQRPAALAVRHRGG
jgi:protein-S-isoprenylcysteine O-methyltransferase Ste14